MASAVPIEALATLRRRLAALSARHSDRRLLMDSTAQLYAISRATLYRFCCAKTVALDPLGDNEVHKTVKSRGN